jgi:hypothetical protein
MPDAEADYTIDWDDAPAAPLPPPRAAARARATREVIPRYEPDDRDEDGTGPDLPAKTDRDLAVIQGTAARQANRDASQDEVKAGVVADAGDQVELLGKSFRIADRIGLMPLLKFSSAADVDTSDPRAMSAMYSLLRDCIYAGEPGCGECADCEAGNDRSCASYVRGDWNAFEEHAMITKADAEALLDVVAKVLELVSGRPTPPPAGSSPGQRRTRRASTGSSSRTARGRGSRR